MNACRGCTQPDKSSLGEPGMVKVPCLTPLFFEAGRSQIACLEDPHVISRGWVEADIAQHSSLLTPAMILGLASGWDQSSCRSWTLVCSRDFSQQIWQQESDGVGRMCNIIAVCTMNSSLAASKSEQWGCFKQQAAATFMHALLANR